MKKRLIPALAAACAMTSAAFAGDATWSANPVDGDWIKQQNWDTSSPPGGVGTTTNPDAANFTGGSTVLAVFPDAGRNIAKINVSASDAYSLGSAAGPNNALTLSDKGAIALSGAATTPFRIYTPLVLAGDLDIMNTAGNANRVFNIFGTVSGSAAAGATNTLAFGGSNTGVNFFSNTISDGLNGGALAIVKNGAGNMHLQTDNTFSGGFTLNSGGVFYYTPDVFGAGPVTIKGGMFKNELNAHIDLKPRHFFWTGTSSSIRGTTAT